MDMEKQGSGSGSPTAEQKTALQLGKVADALIARTNKAILSSGSRKMLPQGVGASCLRMNFYRDSGLSGSAAVNHDYIDNKPHGERHVYELRRSTKEGDGARSYNIIVMDGDTGGVTAISGTEHEVKVLAYRKDEEVPQRYVRTEIEDVNDQRFYIATALCSLRNAVASQEIEG